MTHPKDAPQTVFANPSPFPRPHNLNHSPQTVKYEYSLPKRLLKRGVKSQMHFPDKVLVQTPVSYSTLISLKSLFPVAKMHGQIPAPLTAILFFFCKKSIPCSHFRPFRVPSLGIAFIYGQPCYQNCVLVSSSYFFSTSTAVSIDSTKQVPSFEEFFLPRVRSGGEGGGED